MNFKEAYKLACAYGKENFIDYKDGFKSILDLGDAWFFECNDTKSGDVIYDNYLGIIINKEDLTLKEVIGGTSEHNRLKDAISVNLLDYYLN